MCDEGFTEQSLFLCFSKAQPSVVEFERRVMAAPPGNREKLLRPEERVPEVARNALVRMWNGDVLIPIEEVIAHMPNCDPYETKGPPAALEQILAMLQWAGDRRLTVQVLRAMICRPGNGYNEHFTTVPLDLTPAQLARLVTLEESTLRAELAALVEDRPKMRPDTAAA